MAVLLTFQAAWGALSGSACLPTASRCAWSEQPQCSPSLVVDDLDAGRLRRESLELVIAHGTEDITWSDPYDSIRTVYTRPEIYNGDIPASIRRASHVVNIRNTGLEQYSCAVTRDKLRG